MLSAIPTLRQVCLARRAHAPAEIVVETRYIGMRLLASLRRLCRRGTPPGPGAERGPSELQDIDVVVTHVHVHIDIVDADELIATATSGDLAKLRLAQLDRFIKDVFHDFLLRYAAVGTAATGIYEWLAMSSHFFCVLF